MIDSHCHLDQEPMFSDLKNVILRSKEVGVEKILSICTTKDELRRFYKMEVDDYIIPCRRLTVTNIEYSEYPSTYTSNVLDTNRLESQRANDPKISVKNVSLDSFYVAAMFSHKYYKDEQQLMEKIFCKNLLFLPLNVY